jgi:hypothetical protein
MSELPQITVQHYRGGVRLMIGNRVMVTLSRAEAEQLMVDIPAALERAAVFYNRIAREPEDAQADRPD